MGEKSMVDFVEEWQTGFFLIIGSVVFGIFTAFVVRPYTIPRITFLSFFGGGIVGFAILSYLLYGR
jgi:hypothetical protein